MGQKILIVDDEADIIMMVEARLSAAGYDVVSAVNGVDALDKLQGDKPDLIITDILMPEMDGFALYKKLKEDQATAGIPVLVLSARGKMEDTFRVMGADDFITKPFDSKAFIEKVKELLGGAGSSDSAKEQPAETAEKENSPDAVKKTESVQTRSKQKVLVAGENRTVVDQMDAILKGKNCDVERIEKDSELLQAAANNTPDMIVLDVLFGNGPPHGVILKLRKLSDFRDKPILAYSFLDKDNLSGMSVPQKALEIDKAKKACLDAGATKFIGGFEEQAFTQAVDEFIQH